jgi:hypothetical protein
MHGQGRRKIWPGSKKSASGRRGCWPRNQRGIDIAREHSYKDGSAISQLLKRTDANLPNNPNQSQHAATVERDFSDELSKVDPCES